MPIMASSAKSRSPLCSRCSASRMPESSAWAWASRNAQMLWFIRHQDRRALGGISVMNPNDLLHEVEARASVCAPVAQSALCTPIAAPTALNDTQAP